MNCFAFPNISILVHDGNNFSFLSVDNSSCSDNWNVIDAVIINALYINLAASLGYNPHIFTCNTAIGTSIYQGSLSCGTVGQHTISDFSHVDFTICDAIEINFSWSRSEEHTSELQSRLHLVC